MQKTDDNIVVENDMRAARPDLAVSEMSRSFRKKNVLDRVSFTASAGDCVGIVGINGSGKSTLLSILAGIGKPTSGRFTCFGREMIGNKAAFEKLIGYLPQENPLLEDLSSQDNLRLWYGGHVPSDLPVLDELQLRELLPLKVRSLSGGMKRRLAIACAAAKNQSVLIMDEPPSSLDLHQKEIIRNYIRTFISRGGIVILSTHDEQEMRLCTRLFYLKSGVMSRVLADEAAAMLRAGEC